jgi:hypothetical protein
VGKWTNLTAWPLKWARKKILFCLLDFTILSHFIILVSCSSILSHWLFIPTIVRALTEEKKRVPWTQTTRQLETNSIHQPSKKTIPEASWLLKGREFGAVYVILIQTNKSEIKVSRMQIRVVCLPCFEVYHTKMQFWGQTDTKLEEQNNLTC